ncbi:hypothetical protein F4860DRAFT_467909 [Xylaria cubensis]|nr:hypothetical protein F4860DRAFT_467909 [Xylaria cubensis]
MGYRKLFEGLLALSCSFFQLPYVYSDEVRRAPFVPLACLLTSAFDRIYTAAKITPQLRTSALALSAGDFRITIMSGCFRSQH